MSQGNPLPIETKLETAVQVLGQHGKNESVIMCEEALAEIRALKARNEKLQTWIENTCRAFAGLTPPEA